MNEQLSVLRSRLLAASLQRGNLTKIAQAANVSSRTIYSVIHSDRTPSVATLDKLAAYFKRADKKAERGAK